MMTRGTRKKFVLVGKDLVTGPNPKVPFVKYSKCGWRNQSPMKSLIQTLIAHPPSSLHFFTDMVVVI